MPLLKQHPHPVRLMAIVLIVSVLQACTSWHARPLPLRPEYLSPSVRPGNLRLTLTDGSKLTVLRPVIRGDSLFGEGHSGWIEWGNRGSKRLSPVALPLTRVRVARVEETDEEKTFLLVAGTVVTLAALIALVVDLSNDCYGLVAC